MDNENIKEILKKIKSVSNFDDYVDFVGTEFKPLLDYITILQQRIEGLEAENETLRSDFKNQVEYTNKIAEENERLKEEQEHNNYCAEQLRKKISNLEYKITTLEDYKSRCEKANDKIQYIIDYGFDYDGFNTVESLKGLIDMLVDYAKQSKDILQKGSDGE